MMVKPKELRASLAPRVFCLCMFALILAAQPLCAAGSSGKNVAPMGISIKVDSADSPKDVSQSIKIVLLLTALSLAPSAIIMMTSFTRILIVFGLLQRALGTQQTPPAQVTAAMSLFLTIFIMMPVFQKINTDAVKPYLEEKISHEEAWEKGLAPLRQFMGRQTGESELALFVELSGEDMPSSLDDVGTATLIPAFMISELKTALQMGFLIYLPFLVIDLVIACSLMSLGMMMLPPMMISLPIKILFFVLADGWVLLVRGIVTSFSL